MIFGKRRKVTLALSLLIFLHLILLANTIFTLWPEIVVYPYLLNNNFLLYKDIINPYPPLLTYLLSVFSKFFGYSPEPYKILTWIVIILCDLMIFYIVYKISKRLINAYISVLFFAILSIPLQINGLWFDLIQTPLIILAFYNFFLFMNKNKERYLFFSLMILVIAFLIKQQIIWLTLWFAATSIYKNKYKSKEFVKVLTSIFALIILLVAVLALHFIKLKTLPDFFFWTLVFPFTKASSMPGYILLPTQKQLLAIVSLFFLTSPLLLPRRTFQNFAYFTSLTLLLFAYPRFDYFHLIPSLSILAISLGSNIINRLNRNLFLKSLAILSLIYLIVFTGRYFKNNWHKDTRFFERDIRVAAQNLSATTTKNTLIYIQNGPDQLLPLSSRLPPKPWADEFSWYLELHGVQQKIVDSIKMQNVQYVVYKPYETSETFTLGSYRPKIIADYLDANYTNFVKLSEDLSLKKKLIKDDDTKSVYKL